MASRRTMFENLVRRGYKVPRSRMRRRMARLRVTGENKINKGAAPWHD